MPVDRIDERDKKMALRGKRKRKKAKRWGQCLAQEIPTRETGATVEALQTQKQRGKTHRTGNRTKRKGTQNRKPNKQPTTPNGGGGSDNHTKNAQKIASQQWHI